MLGAVKEYVTSSQDLNNCIDFGKTYWWASSTPSNSPIDQSYGCVTTYPTSPDTLVQYSTNRQSGGSTWMRTRESSGWTTWQRVDNFGCTTAADLASLLGVARGKITSDETVDLSGPLYGYGLLIIDNIGSGITTIYSINAFSVEKLTSTNAGETVAKTAEYTLSITRASGKSTRYTMISYVNL